MELTIIPYQLCNPKQKIALILTVTIYQNKLKRDYGGCIFCTTSATITFLGLRTKSACRGSGCLRLNHNLKDTIVMPEAWSRLPALRAIPLTEVEFRRKRQE